MSEMVEKVARAIVDTWAAHKIADGTWEEAVRGHAAGAAAYPALFEIVELARKEARAAIEAMREPGDAVLKAGAIAFYGSDEVVLAARLPETFAAMIDRALT